jgi:phosphoglycerol transferase MdoB-like AlkP superfamily enzyme
MTRAQWALVSTASVCFSFLWAMLCNLVVEYMQTGGRLDYLRDYTFGRFLPLFLLGATLVWILLLLVWALTRRLWVACAVMIALAVPLAYANYKKVNLRLEPLYPSDFGFAGQAGFLRDMVGLGPIFQVLTVVLLMTLILWLFARVLRRTWKPTERRVHPRRWRAVVVTRVLVVALTSTVVFSAAHFNDTGNPVRATYEASGARWMFWFQKINYRRNGFVGGMLYNLDTPAMTKPAGYSRATMEAITAKYAAEADAINADRRSGVIDDYNVVLVLSEAFSDPKDLEGVEYAEDPIPRTREVMAETTSGRMLAQLFGGGTANMEFEVLTGMSLSQFMPQMQTPYSMLVPEFESFPSAVGLLANGGHEPIAMHPYMTSMYKREATYPILGFDRFLGEDDFEDAKRIDKSDFISDASAFAQVRRELDRSDTPQLVNLVTMQNHYPMKDSYRDPLPVTGVCCEYKNEAEGYGRGLKHTDDALDEFLTGLERSDEKTAVVFYGDHLPAFWPPAVRDENGEIAMRSTPFFIWANTPIEKSDTPAVTSPIYFLPMLYDALGAQLPPYYALLRELQREIPAMEQGVYLDSNGEPIAVEKLSAHARQLLHDYRLVQYDLSVGARYSQDELFYPASVTSAAAE